MNDPATVPADLAVLPRTQRFARRLQQLRTTHGIATALACAPLLAWNAALGPASRSWPADNEGRAFDARHGVDTAGIIPLAHLETSAPNWVHGFDYQPVEVFDIERVCTGLALDYAATDFVDLGAGKGRALMVASQAPFRRLIGVEIAPALVAIARANIARFAPAGAAARFDVVCGDAAAYAFAPRPTVLFMYNPFDAPVMLRVAGNAARAVREHGERLVVIYFRPELEAAWSALPGFTCVRATSRYRVYDSAPDSAAQAQSVRAVV